MAQPTRSSISSPAAAPPPSPVRRRKGRRTAAATAGSPLSDGAVIERLARMRAACQALAVELAGTRRELKVVKAELRKLEQHDKRRKSRAAAGRSG